MTHAKAFLVAIVLLAWPGSIDAWETDEDGRVSLTASFLSGDGPMPTAAEQLFYCSVFQNASNILWQATDGQHYIAEVGFSWNSSWCSDIDWNREDGAAETLTSGCPVPSVTGKIEMYDEIIQGTQDVQPPENLAFILVHELGHLMYGTPGHPLLDEYVASCDDLDGDTLSVCVDDGVTSCIMGKRYTARWCDGTNHVDVDPDYPDCENPAIVVPDYNCWDRAMEGNVDLEHEAGDYPGVGLPPETLDCKLLQNDGELFNDAVLLLDRSGSMGYTSPIGIPAIRLAADAALMFYNKTEPGQFSGVLAFNNQVMNPWPIPYGAFNGEETFLNLTAMGLTDICQAIDEGAQAIIDEGNDLNHDLVLFSDGKDTTGCNPVDAASDVFNQHGICVHTLAYGDADRDELQDIAEATCGMAFSLGTLSLSANEPDPEELKLGIARSRLMLERRLGVFERLELLDTTGPAEEQTFHVPAGSDAVDFVWLGNRWNDCPAGPCPCSFDALQFELESPSAVVVSSIAVDATVDGEYRTARVTTPEAGIWTARIDSSGLDCGTTSHNLRIGWLGHVVHPEIEAGIGPETSKAPTDSPIRLQATLRYGSRATNIAVAVSVKHLGQEWAVPMNDDGTGADELAGDGIYTGVFNETAQTLASGLYRVTAKFTSQAGVATVATGAILPDPAHPTPPPAAAPGNATVMGETSFRLSTRFSRDLQGRIVTGTLRTGFSDLQQGQSYSGLTMDIAELPLVDGRNRIGLGSRIAVSNIRVVDNYPAPNGQLIFDATVDALAPTGLRDAGAQFHREIVRQEGAFTVSCSAANVTPGEASQLAIGATAIPDELQFDWTPAPGASSGHTIYEGTLDGQFDSLTCLGTTGVGATMAVLPTAPGSRYFLIAGVNDGAASCGLETDGPLGTDSSGASRTPPATSCP